MIVKPKASQYDLIPTTSHMAHNSSQPITPTVNTHTLEPKTKNEVVLVATLHEVEAEVKSLRAQVLNYRQKYGQ
jgi:hypothetical protein